MNSNKLLKKNNQQQSMTKQDWPTTTNDQTRITNNPWIKRLTNNNYWVKTEQQKPMTTTDQQQPITKQELED